MPAAVRSLVKSNKRIKRRSERESLAIIETVHDSLNSVDHFTFTRALYAGLQLYFVLSHCMDLVYDTVLLEGM